MTVLIPSRWASRPELESRPLTARRLGILTQHGSSALLLEYACARDGYPFLGSI